MQTSRIVTVKLPDGFDPSPEDLELLEAALHAVAALPCQLGRTCEATERALIADGWSVRTRLLWVAEARRGHDYEQAVAPTRDEALAQLENLTRIDAVTGVP